MDDNPSQSSWVNLGVGAEKHRLSFDNTECLVEVGVIKKNGLPTTEAARRSQRTRFYNPHDNGAVAES